MPIHHSRFNNPFEKNDQNVTWKDNLPFSDKYQDIYFQDDAVAEINDVFINPNQLINRIQNDSRLHVGEPVSYTHLRAHETS